MQLLRDTIHGEAIDCELHARARRSTRMILLVEDHAEMRRFLGTELRRDGHAVIELSSGEDALVWLSRSTHDDPVLPYPDLVISDVRMPGPGGFDILETLRAIGDPLPVILITAFPDPALELRARDLAAAALIEKPFDISDLLAAAREILDSEDPGHA